MTRISAQIPTTAAFLANLDLQIKGMQTTISVTLVNSNDNYDVLGGYDDASAATVVSADDDDYHEKPAIIVMAT